MQNQALEFRPPIQLSQDDFQAITQQGKLLSPSGALFMTTFKQMILNELRDYVSRQIGKQQLLPQNQRFLSSLFSAINYLPAKQTANLHENNL